MPSFLDEALVRYQDGLAELSTAKNLSHEQILLTLLARDKIQSVITDAHFGNAETLIKVATLDQKLKQFAGIIQETADFENWRLSYNPKKESWWWFLDLIKEERVVESSINSYEAVVISLENTDSKIVQQNIEKWFVENLIKAFTLRDKIQTEINSKKFLPEELVRISTLDKRLRRKINRLSQILNSEILRKLNSSFDELRDVLNPPYEAWWWFLKIPAHWWDRCEPVWTMLTVFWLTGTFGLLTDISTRFLGGGGPGTFGALAIIFQSILALIGGGSITKKGQIVVDRTLTQWKVPKRLWQEVKFGGATVLLLLFVGFRLSLPRISVRYNNSAIEDYLVGNLDSAESKLKRALELNPGYVRAHYNLGVVYEDLGKREEAQVQYNLAVAGAFVPAYNNQARLSILFGNYATAVNLLEKGIALAKINDTDENPENDTSPVVEHDLWKNLGWARYEQGYYFDAEESLKTAIEVADISNDLQQEAAPHCLLAQTYERLEEHKNAQISWQGCLKFPRNPDNAEEDGWQKMAQERLQP